MFYGWILLIVVSVINFLAVGAIFFGFGVVLPSMIADMGWSRGDASIGFAIMTLSMGFFGPLVALVMRRLGVRMTVFFGGFFTALGAVMTYFSTSLFLYYIGAGLMVGIGMAMQTVVPCSLVMANWFVRRRAMAMGIFLSSSGVGAFVAAPLYAYVIETTGNWHLVWLIMAAAGMVAGVLGCIFLREQPSDMGLLPDGAKEPDDLNETSTSDSKRHRVYISPIDWETKPAMKTPSFWCVVIAGTVAVLGGTIVNSQVVLHLTDIGVSSVMAASALGMQGLCNTGGRLITASLGDRIEPRHLLTVGMAAELLGVLILPFASETALVYTFVVLFGMGYGLSVVAGSTLIANYFGSKNFAMLNSTRVMIVTGLAALGPIAAGYAADRLGSFSSVFYAFSAIALMTLVMIIFVLREPTDAEVAAQEGSCRVVCG